MENNEQPPIPSMSIDKNKLILPASILIAAFLISGSLFYTRAGGSTGGGTIVKNDKEQKIFEVSVDDDAYLGDISAPIKIIEFSDFQCPFCRKFWKEIIPLIKKDYVDTGKAVLIYRDFPLSIHPAAQISAEASECAHEQGKFWEMHDKIFSEEEKKGTGTVEYGVTELKKWAREIGLNSIQFNQCLDSQKYKTEVGKDFSDGSKVSVSGTPTTFINGRPVVGSQPYSAFKSILDEELNNTQKEKNSFFK